MAFGLGTDRPSDDSVRDVVDASSAVIRIVQNRPLFTAVLAGSFALHFFLLLLIVLLESGPAAKTDATVEIPVELVSASQADSGGVTGSRSAKAEPKGQNAQNSEQQAAKSSAKAGQQQAVHAESKPAQTASKPAQQTAEQKPPQSAPKQQAAENKPPPPAQPPEQAKPEPPKQAATQPPPSAKPASPPAEPPKQVAAAAQKPVAPPEPPKPPPATPSPAAQSPAAQTPPQPTAPLVPPPTLAALPPPVSPSEPGGSPLGLMSDDWHAVAVPKPSADGDEQLSYKTVVFGMLELNKRFPQDARARGASGSSTIYFELNDDGSVRTVRILESSGDTSLDVESLAIVMRSSPFPKPPRGAQKIFAATIEFNPNER